MLRYLLAVALTVPLCGHCQTYADSTFYKRVPGVPSTARVEGWGHGSINANGIVIDLSEAVPSSSPDFDEIRGWSLHSWVDRDRPAHLFHFFQQYDQLNVIYGYDLLVEPIEGTDKIRCTFSSLTDPEIDWHRDKAIPVVPLPSDLVPVEVKSGDVLSFTTLPLGPGRIAAVHYLRLTRADPRVGSDSAR